MKDRRIALLRGINVGRAKRVAMADLRAVVEGLGYCDVRTVLNSGNVVFSAPGETADRAAHRIEAALPGALGVASKVTALTAETLAAIVADNPLKVGAGSPSRLMVVFLGKASDRSRLLGHGQPTCGARRDSWSAVSLNPPAAPSDPPRRPATGAR